MSKFFFVYMVCQLKNQQLQKWRLRQHVNFMSNLIQYNIGMDMEWYTWLPIV